MTVSIRRRLRPRPVTGAVTLALTAALLAVAGPAHRAAADPLGDARARAAALAATVDRLQTAAEVATEHYDAVEARLGQAVTERMLAERELENDQAQTRTAAEQITDRVRALYESGGQAALLATVLDGGNPTDAFARLHVVTSLLTWDDGDLAAATAVQRRATGLEARLSAAAATVTRLQHAALTDAARVQSLLDAQRKALAAADAQVRSLLAAAQAAAAAADARSFEQALLDAGGSLSGDTTAPNPVVARAIAAARSRLGDAYVWGATGPTTFDCSGLTQWSYAQAGVTLPRVAADQWNAGPHVGLADLEPGDLLFWATDVTNPATIHHVAMYLGAGMMIEAPHTGDVVKITPVYMNGYIGATRPYVATA